MLETDMIRHNHQIDPQLHIWGWEIPLYLFLGGVTAGLMILGALLHLRNKASPGAEGLSRWARWLPFAAPILLSVGMLALFLDLAHREHVYRFYLTLRPTSPMSWGSWILLGIYPATLLLGLLGLQEAELERLKAWGPVAKLKLGRLLHWAHTLARDNGRTVLWSNLILGIALGAYTGLLLGTLAARPAWNSVVLGPLFLVSGLSTGAALMMLFPMAEDEHHTLRRWDMLAILVEVTLIGLFFLSLLTSGGEPGRQAAELFFGGRYTAAFWSLVVLLGLAVPLLLEWIESRRKLAPTLMAPALILIGGLSLRWVLVLAGQAF